MADFENFLKTLKRQPTDKRTLFELFLNRPLYEKLAGRPMPDEDKLVSLEKLKFLVEAFRNAGYDYATTYASNYRFERGEHSQNASVSLNEGAIITDRESFDNYPWREAGEFPLEHLDAISSYLPENMKLNIMGPGGVFENVIALTGFDNLCYMLADDEPLLADIFDAVGRRLVDYYTAAARYESVGVLTSNDDWGFNTQTFFPVDVMRKYVFPWHKKIVEAIHGCGKPALLHSCGNLAAVMDDVIDDMRYDAKHSYEDNIMRVEDAWGLWGDRICILGGIDVNFLINSPIEEIQKRCRNLLEITAGQGGYMLGSGNSIPEYIPDEKYFSMIRCIRHR